MIFLDFSKFQFWKIWNQKNQNFQNFEEILGIGRWKFFKFASKSLPGPMVCLWIWKFWKFCSKLKKNGRSSLPPLPILPLRSRPRTSLATAPSGRPSLRSGHELIVWLFSSLLPLSFLLSSSFFLLFFLFSFPFFLFLSLLSSSSFLEGLGFRV